MEVLETKEGGITVLTPRGRVDSVTCKPFEQHLMGVIDAGERRVIVDFVDLDYVSSAGLRVLLMGAKKQKAAGGRLILCAMRDHIREVFDVSGFSSILEIKKDRNESLIALG
jgi:anti-sigma B factor antagonist